MPVIKSNDSDGLSSQGLSLECVESRARAIIEKARGDAARVLQSAVATARAQADEIREQARQEGFETGQAEGLARGQEAGQAEAHAAMREQLESLVSSWTTLLDDWTLHEQEVRQDAARRVLDLAVSLSERLVHRHVEVDPSIVVDQLRQALDLAQSPADLEIIVAESDRQRVHHALPGLLERFDAIGYVSIRACPEMAAGGCRLQMRGGEIDASLEVQLQRLTDAILPCRHQEIAEGEAA
ncbi:MAG: hypothetical protein MK116_01275 [Phycisphaerales bacterium]|nr:hypothetical protein [Phycisphaerales bacterium]